MFIILLLIFVLKYRTEITFCHTKLNNNEHKMQTLISKTKNERAVQNWFQKHCAYLKTMIHVPIYRKDTTRLKLMILLYLTM